MIGTIRRPTVFDVEYLTKNARQADKDEAFLLSGKGFAEVLNQTPGLYKNSFTWEVNGRLVCMYGATPWEGKKAMMWFLATDEFDKHKRAARVQCKKLFEEVIEGYDYLFNYVHYKHDKALKWVRWLGCTVYEPEPIGLNGELFCKIEVNNV